MTVDYSALAREAKAARRAQALATPAHVYRVYDEDGLIYIGCTSRLWLRLTEHRRYSWWSVAARKVRAELAPNLVVGRRREVAAILAEEPRWNVYDQGRLIPDWSQSEFAAYLRRWLINDRNVVRWHEERQIVGIPRRDSAAQFERLLRRYQIHHDQDFNMDLIGDCELPPGWVA